jgi:hypothetical protein
MTPAFSARRRADEFEALVGAGVGARPDAEGVRRGRDEAAFAELLELVGQLRTLPSVEPRPDFVSGLRERLMTEADDVLVAADPAESRLVLPARTTRRERRLATVLGGAALVGATASMAVAAQTALPGDSLYPVKRALESAQAGLAGDGTERGETLLDSASDRLAEVDELARRGTPEGIAAVPDTLTLFTEQSAEASTLLLESYEETGDEAPVTELRVFTEQSLQSLLQLEAALPDSARDELAAAAQGLAAIDQRTRDLCPSCPGEGITEVPSILLSAGFADAGLGPAPIAEAPLVPSVKDLADAGDGGRDGGGQGIEIPDLDGAVDPDGGATGGGDDPGTGGTTPTDGEPQDPVRELTNLLAGDPEGATGGGSGGSGGTKTNTSTEPLDQVLDGLGDAVDDTTGDLLQ